MGSRQQQGTAVRYGQVQCAGHVGGTVLRIQTPHFPLSTQEKTDG